MIVRLALAVIVGLVLGATLHVAMLPVIVHAPFAPGTMV